MRKNFLFVTAIAFLFGCNSKSESDNQKINIQGTWKLVSGAITDKKSGKATPYQMDFQMIKIINNTHFAFLKHSLNKQDSLGFDAGGGSYKLNNDKYEEHLEYYSNKNWEGKKFDFKVSLINDTLIQSGVEQVEKEGIDRVIIEKYIKMK